LIWRERKRLEEFHIGYGALGIFILGPIMFSIILRVMSFSSTPQNFISIPWLQIAIALSLLAALIVKRPNLQKVTVKSVIWIIVSVVIGLVIGALSGYIISFAYPTQRGPAIAFPVFIFRFVRQLTQAATLEEPLFRGFLWGYLKRAGWKDIWICFFQSGLFVISHAYYITVNPILLVNVFICAFILGLVVWKSRSIANSMTVHGLFNSVADVVASSSF
jgi:membrane protease YdiL (CAAX protease family)